MKTRILIDLVCVLALTVLVSGCTQGTDDASVETQLQTVEVDSSKLEEAADKLNEATDKMIDMMEKEPETEDLLESHRILILVVNPSGQEFSDRTQADNALNNGGQIVIKGFEKDEINKAFTDEYGWYGAVDAAGYSFTRGDVLNWISACGWEYVGTDTYGNSTDYYFRR